MGGNQWKPGKARFNSPRILLDSGARSSIILGKHTQKLLKKKTKLVGWSTQGCDFNTNFTTKVYTVLPELDVKKM